MSWKTSSRQESKQPYTVSTVTTARSARPWCRQMDPLKTEALPIYNDLLASLKKSAFIRADGTGWPIDGINHWLWKFSNKKICFSHIDKGRGQNIKRGQVHSRSNIHVGPDPI